MPKVRRKLMDKELNKMEFKLNGLSVLYRVQTRQAVQSPLYLNTLEEFQKWNLVHRLTHKSTKLSPKSTMLPECPQVCTKCSCPQVLTA